MSRREERIVTLMVCLAVALGGWFAGKHSGQSEEARRFVRSKRIYCRSIMSGLHTAATQMERISALPPPDHTIANLALKHCTTNTAELIANPLADRIDLAFGDAGLALIADDRAEAARHYRRAADIIKPVWSDGAAADE
jgi:hypothetical protein